MKPSDAVIEINKIISYSESCGYKVILKRKTRSYFCPFEKVIIISKDQKEENILYLLLHEIGHMLLYKKKSYKKKYGLAASILDKNVIKTALESKELAKKLSSLLEFRISLLKEEIDAWDCGLQFAQKNNININFKNLSNLRNICIKGYCVWVHKPKNAFI